MRSFQEFKTFHETVLTPEILPLEAERKKILFQVVSCWVGGIVITITLAFCFLISSSGDMFFIVLAGGIFFCWFMYFSFMKRYTSDFKEVVIRRIISFMDEGLAYAPDACISQDTYHKSDIFRTDVDVYDGDDLVGGRIDKTDLSFSELHTQYITYDSEGRATYHTIFKGLFFVADFHKKFKTKTFVLPDQAERILGGLGSWMQSMNKGRGELVKLEDPEFEKMFVVYGQDQVEARYILSTSLMKRIVDFYKQTKRTIHISFVDSQVYVAISFWRSLFEPNLFKSLLDFGEIQEYYEDLGLALGIVDDLKLNTRIWG